MIAAFCGFLSLQSPALPDRVLILGSPAHYDVEPIRRDCQTWKDVWTKRGLRSDQITYDDAANEPAKVLNAIAKLKSTITAGTGGVVWLCISGHGDVRNHLPVMKFQPNGKELTTLSWTQVFKTLALPTKWSAVLIADMCHNNMLGKVLPQQYQAIVVKQEIDDEQCKMVSYKYDDGERGVLSWIAQRSLSKDLSLTTMRDSMAQLSVADGKRFTMPQVPTYGFRIETWHPELGQN